MQTGFHFALQKTASDDLAGGTVLFVYYRAVIYYIFTYWRLLFKELIFRFL